MKSRFGVWGLATNVILFAFAISTLYPVLWVAINSVKTQLDFSQSTFALPTEPTLQSYREIFENGTVWLAMANSVFYAIVSTVVIVTLSFSIAYALARYDFPGRRLVLAFFVLGLLLPVPALLVPVFMQYRAIGILNTQYTLLIPYTAFGLSLGVFLIEGYIRKIPVELDEAAHVDGASVPRVMFVIIFPICRPAIATVALLSFLNAWNDFAFATTLLRDNAYKPVSLWLRTFSEDQNTDYPGMMAGIMIASLPVVLLFLFFRERIVEGFASGVVKG